MKSVSRLAAYLTPLMVVALSFGYAVGWGSFVMPGTVFLPGAGPAGTIIGILLGAAAIAVFAFNYHRMLQRVPGPGGAVAFTTKAFGADHGFLLAWFLWLTYVAILWANATALVLLVRYLFGDAFQFGFHYTMAGFHVYFGEVLLCVLAIAFCGAVCLYRKRFAIGLHTILAGVFLAGVVAVFAAALCRHDGSFAAMGPAFAPEGGRVMQVVRILAMVPWAFVGFEAVVHSSAEFRFPVRRMFGLLVTAIAISAAVYLVLAVWCLCGFLQYRHVFLVDWLSRFGHTIVVWIGVLAMIFFSSLMWIRLAVCDASEAAFGGLIGKTVDSGMVERIMEHVGNDMLLKMVVELLLFFSSLAIILNLFYVLSRREKRLLQQKIEAEESAGKSRSYFFSTVNHDIRTPLNAIIGFSEMMKMGFKTDSEREQAVDSILVSGKSLLRLVDHVLDFSKLESGNMEIVPTPTEVSKLVGDVVETFRASNANSSLDLRCKVGALPARMVDPQRIGQMLVDLVGNAQEALRLRRGDGCRREAGARRARGAGCAAVRHGADRHVDAGAGRCGPREGDTRQREVQGTARPRCDRRRGAGQAARRGRFHEHPPQADHGRYDTPGCLRR